MKGTTDNNPTDRIKMRVEDDGRISMSGNVSADGFSQFIGAAEESDALAEAQRKSGRLGPAKPDAPNLSPQQAAEWLGVHRSTVDRMVSDGILRAVRFRQGRRKKLIGISRKELERFVKEQENKGVRKRRET